MEQCAAFERTLLTVSALWIGGIPTLFVFANRTLEGVRFVTFDRIFYLAVAALLALCLLRRPRLLPSSSNVGTAIVAYLAMVVLSWFITLAHKDPTSLKQDADFLLTSFLMPFTAYLVARNVVWTRRRVMGYCWVLVGGVGMYLAVVGIVQSTYDWHFLGLEVGQCIQCERAKGPFGNSLPYGMVLSILLTLGLFLYQQSRTRTARVAALVIVAVLSEAIVLSKGRAVWLGVLLAMLLVGYRCRRVRRLAALVCAGLLGQVLVSSSLPTSAGAPSERGTLKARLTEVESIYDRIAVYSTDVNMIVHKPLFGFGFGLSTFQRHKADYTTSCCGVSPEWAADCHVPHNELLNVLILMGVVGLVAYLFLVRASWRALSMNDPHGRADSLAFELSLFVQASFVLLVITAQFHDVMYMSYVQILFFFLLGIVVHRSALEARLVDLERAPW